MCFHIVGTRSVGKNSVRVVNGVHDVNKLEDVEDIKHGHGLNLTNQQFIKYDKHQQSFIAH